jgi:hypothetical protein
MEIKWKDTLLLKSYLKKNILKKLKFYFIFYFKLIIFIFLYRFNVLISKIAFKKNYFNIFINKNYFEK